MVDAMARLSILLVLQHGLGLNKGPSTACDNLKGAITIRFVEKVSIPVEMPENSLGRSIK